MSTDEILLVLSLLVNAALTAWSAHLKSKETLLRLTLGQVCDELADERNPNTP